MAEPNAPSANDFLQRSPLLAWVRELSSGMTGEDRRLTVRQLVVLLRDYYVHLPLKRSSLGIDPVQEANLLVDELPFIPTEGDLFRRISDILKRLRDRHTALRLPSPWRDMVAYLPFAVESYFDAQGRYLVVSKLMTALDEGSFVPGVKITHWNGIPIRRYVEVLSWESNGANPYARIAVTLRSLTVRPLGYMAQPDEDWVTLTYQTEAGQYRSIVIPWRIYVAGPGAATAGANTSASAQTVPYQGVDRNSLIVNSSWYDLYAQRGSGEGADLVPNPVVSTMRWRTVPAAGATFGYIRIFSFDVPDPAAFVNGFAQLLSQMPSDGLIIDVRSNPGGSIPAGEGLLALFTQAEVSPQPVSFRNTAAVRRLGTLPLFSKWKRSLDMQFETGEIFTQGFSLSERTGLEPRAYNYKGPVVLIIDALCYSTTDFFTAGMQDNGLAAIIGVDPVTGAGGANVWNHALLSQFVVQAGGDDLQPMPSNIDIDISVRRSIRVGPNDGLPVEGLGVFADHFYQLTRRDVLGQNEDLIDFAAKVLASRRGRQN